MINMVFEQMNRRKPFNNILRYIVYETDGKCIYETNNMFDLPDDVYNFIMQSTLRGWFTPYYAGNLYMHKPITSMIDSRERSENDRTRRACIVRLRKHGYNVKVVKSFSNQVLISYAREGK